MSHETDRRTFLKTGAAVAATTATSATLRAQDAPKAEAKSPQVITKRPLGKTGVDITMLNQGAVRGSGYDRILRLSYQSGVRTFDTAKAYGTEPNLKKWFEAQPEVRKEIFLVTKDEIKSADKMVASVDDRLKALGTDHIDLFFLHGLGDPNVGGIEAGVKLLKSPEFAKAADTIRKSGKAKLIGFSAHHPERWRLLEAAAESGVVDAVMIQYRPWLEKESPLNKAIDLAWKKGIGIISMKQIAGNGFGDKPKGDILKEVFERAPILKEKGLSPYQALLHAIWTDERISSCCVSMRISEQVRENTDAAKNFEPLKTAEIEQLRDAILAAKPTLCADCDGRCSIAAGTKAELGNLTRFLTYHQHLGDRTEARKQYARLSQEAKDWSGADLAAASEACVGGLDFAALMPKIERHLA